MKIVPKGQDGLVAKSDNTRVAKPIIAEKIPYKLKPNEFYFIDKRTGKKILGRLKQEVVSADNRTTYQRKQDQIKVRQVYKKQEEDKNYEKGLETIDALSKLVMPSTYVGPIFNNNGKSYLDNVMSGEGTGNTAGNLAIDLFTPFGIKGINKGIQTGNRYYLTRQIYKDIDHSTLKSGQIPLNIGWGPKQTIQVSHASNSGNMQLFFPNRWDVVNEGANPHGIWFQGKLGYPRTDFTNPGKGEKAAKARALFANRSMQTQGDLTLEKPIITIGDVPSRSQLSYYADNLGADGIIYNGVYDNGYNNNQVILSFKKMNKTNNKSPIKPSIGDITDETQIRTLYPVYEKMKNSPHYKGLSAPFPEENIGGQNVIILGQLDAGKFSEYQAERIIENMKKWGFNPDQFSSDLWHDGMRVSGRPSTFIRTKAKDPINIYITKEPNSYGGFYNPTTGRAYTRILPNSSAESIRSATIHEGMSHGTDDIINTATKGVAPHQYKEITSAVEKAGFAKTKGTEKWYELRSTMTEFMRKMFHKYARANPEATYADLRNAVYKEIDEMPANVMARGFGVLNAYGQDYARYIIQYPNMAQKFKDLLKYGMGVLPVVYGPVTPTNIK